MHRLKAKLICQKADVVGLYDRAKDGCEIAVETMIDRQQEGRALRYYPDGRQGIDDEGVCPIILGVREDAVVARSGRPNLPIRMDRDIANSWVNIMAESMAELSKYFREGGYQGADAIERISETVDPDFAVSVEISDEEDEVLLVRFSPAGSGSWSIPVWGVQSFIGQTVEAANKLGWVFSGTDHDLKLIKCYIPHGIDIPWETTT